MSTKTGGATETEVKPGDDPKGVAADLLGEAKDTVVETVAVKVSSAALDALSSASEAILAERNEVDPDNARRVQFYDAALKAVDTAIREVTWALEEAAKD